MQLCADLGVVLLATLLALAWSNVLSPSSLSTTLILAGFVGFLVAILAIIVTRLAEISARLSQRHGEWLGTMVRLILRSRREMVLAQWRTPTSKPAERAYRFLVSVGSFFLVYLGYFVLMAVYFYGLGGAPLSNPTYLLIAGFLGVLALHFSRYILGAGRAPTLVLEFLVPFGVIVALLDFEALGGLPWLGAQWNGYGPILVMFFAAYYGVDAIMVRYADRRK